MKQFFLRMKNNNLLYINDYLKLQYIIQIIQNIRYIIKLF